MANLNYGNLQRTVLKSGGLVIGFDCVEVEDADHDATITKYPIEDGAELSDHVIVMPDMVRLKVHLTNSPMKDDATHMNGVRPATALDLRSARDAGFEDASITVRDLAPLVPSVGPAGIGGSGIGAGVGLPGAQSVAGLQIQQSRPLTIRMLGPTRLLPDPFFATVRAWGLSGEAAKRVQLVYEALLTAQHDARVFTIVSEFREFDFMVVKKVHYSRSSKTVRAPTFDLEFQQLNLANLVTRDVSGRLPKVERSREAQDAGKQQPKVADEKTKKSVLKNAFGD